MELENPQAQNETAHESVQEKEASIIKQEDLQC